MRKYDVFLVILGITGLLALGSGDLVITLFFTIILIPVALVLIALPGLALILCSARLVDRLVLAHFLPKGTSGYAALGVVLTALAGLSLVANARQANEIATLMADDHDSLSRPLPDQNYGYLSQDPAETCGEFCQRLLLTGQARAVLLAQADAQTVPRATTPATLWQIKDQPTCPPVTLPAGWALFIPGEEAAPKADLRMGALIAAGHCLIATPATLAAADAVIMDVTLRTRARDASYSLGADQIAASRRSVWLKTDQGFVEQARWTYTSALQMFALALPIVDTNMNAKNHDGFWRVSETRSPDPGFAKFIVETLGLRLGLKDLPPVKTASGEDPLLAALKVAGPLDRNTQQLAITRLDAMFRAQTTTPDDQALLIALLSDPRTILTWQYEAATRTLLRTAAPDFGTTVANIGFARLATLLLPDQHLKDLKQADYYARLKQINPIKEQIYTLGTLLASLPDAALQPHRAALFALPLDPENRIDAFPLLARLSAFGDQGAQAMLDLLAKPDPNERSGFRDWRDVRRAALRGVCALGPSAAKFLPQVLDLVKDHKIQLDSSDDGALAAMILLRLGHPPASILALAQLEPYPLQAHSLDNLVRGLTLAKPCDS